MDPLQILFTDAQRTAAASAKSVIGVGKLLSKLTKGGGNILTSKSSSSSSSEWSTFLASLYDCVNHVLVLWKNEPAIDRIIHFISQIAVLENAVLLQPLFEYLLSRTDCKEKAVRYRSCQIIYTLLENLPMNYTISDTLYTNISNKLLARTKDKLPLIRTVSIKALNRLQDDDNLDACPLSQAIVWATRHETVDEVRAAAVTAIHFGTIVTTTPTKMGTTSPYLSLLLERTQDLSILVRTNAYHRLRVLQLYTFLSPGQKQSLIEYGLTDTSLTVRKACVIMIGTWLHTACSGDIGALLEDLDMVTPYSYGSSSSSTTSSSSSAASVLTMNDPSHEITVPHPETLHTERIAEIMLWSLFAFAEENQPKDISFSDVWLSVRNTVLTTVPSTTMMNPEMALYWRVRAAWMKGTTGLSPGYLSSMTTSTSNLLAISPAISLDKREEVLDSFLPDVLSYCTLVSDIVLSLGCVTDIPGQGHLKNITENDMMIGNPSLPTTSTVRLLAINNGVPVPSYLQTLRTLPINPDTEALATLRQVLILGQLLDYSEETGRRRIISLVLQLLTHPAVPNWCIPLIHRLFTCACSIGKPLDAIGTVQNTVEEFKRHHGTHTVSVDIFNEMIALQCAAIASLRQAVELAMNDKHNGNSDSSSSTNSSTNETLKLQTRAEELRQLLEELEDNNASRKELEKIRDEIETIEERLHTLESSSSMGSTVTHGGHHHIVALEGVEMKTLENSELAGLLWLRALILTEIMLRGINIDPVLYTKYLPVSLASASQLTIHTTDETIDTPLLHYLIGPSLNHPIPEIRLAGIRCATLLAMVSTGKRSTGATLAIHIMPSLIDIVVPKPSAPTEEEYLRITALQAVTDLQATFGTSIFTVNSNDTTNSSNTGTMTDLRSLCISLLQPATLLTKTTSLPVNAVPYNLQMTAVRILCQLLLTGIIPLDNETSSAQNTRTMQTITVLAETYLTFLWLETEQKIQSLLASEANGTNSSANETMNDEHGGGLSRTILSAIGAFFPTYAAVSPLHRAICLLGTIEASRRIVFSAYANNLVNDAYSNVRGTLFGNNLVSILGNVTGKSSTVAASSSSSTTMPTGENEPDTMDNNGGNDNGSVVSGVSALLSNQSNASNGVPSVVVWMGEALSLCLHLATLTPVLPNNNNDPTVTVSSDIPTSTLPPWASTVANTSVRTVSPLGLFAFSVILDANAEATACNGGTFTSLFISLLKQLPVPVHYTPDTNALHYPYITLLNEFSKTAIVQLKNTAFDKAVKKLSETWNASKPTDIPSPTNHVTATTAVLSSRVSYYATVAPKKTIPTTTSSTTTASTAGVLKKSTLPATLAPPVPGTTKTIVPLTSTTTVPSSSSATVGSRVRTTSKSGL